MGACMRAAVRMARISGPCARGRRSRKSAHVCRDSPFAYSCSGAREDTLQRYQIPDDEMSGQCPQIPSTGEKTAKSCRFFGGIGEFVLPPQVSQTDANFPTIGINDGTPSETPWESPEGVRCEAARGMTRNPHGRVAIICRGNPVVITGRKSVHDEHSGLSLFGVGEWVGGVVVLVG